MLNHLPVLFEEGVTLADLLDKKRGKFAWFSHSSETHGKHPRHVCLCAAVSAGPDAGPLCRFVDFQWAVLCLL